MSDEQPQEPVGARPATTARASDERDDAARAPEATARSRRAARFVDLPTWLPTIKVTLAPSCWPWSSAPC